VDDKSTTEKTPRMMRDVGGATKGKNANKEQQNYYK
jgi:hypothetical protein